MSSIHHTEAFRKTTILQVAVSATKEKPYMLSGLFNPEPQRGWSGPAGRFRECVNITGVFRHFWGSKYGFVSVYAQ